MKKKLRIMFAGGCHVLGYPVGPEFGFPQVTLEVLSKDYQCDSRSLGYISFARKDRLLGAFREFAPDVLVLQLEHYECPRPLEKLLQRSRLGMFLRPPSAAKSSSSSSSGLSGPAYIPDPSSAFRSHWKWRLRSSIRLLAALAFECKGEPVFARKKISADLSSLLEAVHAHSQCRIILLSPFLAPDYMIRLYRRRAWKIFRNAARLHDCLFVDSQQLLQKLERSREDLPLYADADHLSVTGHDIVGRHLADQIRAMLALRELSAAQLAVTRTSLTALPGPAYLTPTRSPIRPVRR